jgi:8-oxo-dGTP diphosphatase
MALIRAAGGVVWRPGPGGPSVAVVHRPHREDWSLPKGKLVDGESWAAAAVREVREETGCTVRLGAYAGSTWYVPRKTPKVVVFWRMELVREGPLDAGDEEVDEVAWLPPREALARLDHGNERAVLRGALAREEAVPAPGGASPARAEVGALRARTLERALTRAEVDGEVVGRVLSRLDRAEHALDAGEEVRARALLSRAADLLARTS